MSILANIPTHRVVTNATKSGRVTGNTVHHTGDGSTGFGTLRAQGRALGLSGAALKEWIYSQASGDRAAAAIEEARVLFNLALDRGLVPQKTQLKTNGGAVFTLIPAASKPKEKVVELSPAEKVSRMTAQERHELLALLLEA